MPVRRLPVRPDLAQLRHQAKDLLRAIRAGEADAVEDLRQFHPKAVDPAAAKLADAQLVLARSYQAPSWPRLVVACRLVDAIWNDDRDTVRALVTRQPALLHEPAVIRNSNWGPPLSYAANLGRDGIITMLHQLGATDLHTAIDRATLQGRIGTARLLYDMMGRPRLPDDALGGPAYTLDAAGTELMLEYGVRVVDERGHRLAPVDVVLETDSRKPAAKHRILALYVEHGVTLPDTPTMAVHRGRIDLLAAHLARDPAMLSRTFSHEEMYPPSLGCHDEVLATHGTPLAGATLLHLAIDQDEMEIVRWLLDHGMDPDTRAAVDADGFGGHTALFATVVSQPAYWMNRGHRPIDATAARWLLERGANPEARASLRKQLHPGYGEDERLHEYRDVTPVSWGQRFHRREFVNRAAEDLIAGWGRPEATMDPRG
ncbi:MAG: ankyrin repeat domain-containing protein [Gemmatimonadales bacterium]